MTQLEQIKSQMEELIADINSKRGIYPAPYLNGSEDVAKAVVRLVESLKKEQSQGLDEAAEECAIKEGLIFNPAHDVVVRVFKAGAEWQAGQEKWGAKPGKSIM